MALSWTDLRRKIKPWRTKEEEAARFFLKHFGHMSSDAVDAHVRRMWEEYRGWKKVCAVSGIDPEDTSLRVLDVGGGLTTALRMFKTDAKWVVDTCTEELKRAQAPMKEGIHYVNAPAEDIPFPSSFFTHVFCTNALDHFAQPSTALREMGRVLAPDGYCIITVDVFPVQGEKRDRLHPHTFSIDTVMDLLRGEAFQVVEQFWQPQGGKVGFGQIVQGELQPKRNKAEVIVVVRADGTRE